MGEAGQARVVDLVNLHIEREGHVMAHQLEARMTDQVSNISLRAHEEVVGTDHLVTRLDQPVAEMPSRGTRRHR